MSMIWLSSVTVVSVFSPCTMTTGASVTFLTVWTLVVEAIPTSMRCQYTSNRNVEFMHRLGCYDNSNEIYLSTMLKLFCMCKNLIYEVLVIGNMLKPKQVSFDFS